TPIASNILAVTVTGSSAAVDAGGPYAITPSGTASVTFAATALGTPTSYVWTVNGVNSDPSTSSTLNVSWTGTGGLQQKYNVNNSGQFQVTVTVGYADGTSVTSAATTLNVSNVNPTATFTASPGSVAQGGSASVEFTNPFSYLGGAIPFKYAFDLLNDGNY